MGQRPQRAAATRQALQWLRELQHLQNGDRWWLADEPFIGRRDLVHAGEWDGAAHRDVDGTGELLLSRAHEYRAWPLCEYADGNLLPPSEGLRRQRGGESAGAGSVQHDALQDQGGERRDYAADGAQVRRAWSVPDLPVQLRPDSETASA